MPQQWTTRWAKKNFLRFDFESETRKRNWWPRDDEFLDRMKNESVFMQEKPCTILKQITKSAISFLYSSVGRLSMLNRSE